MEASQPISPPPAERILPSLGPLQREKVFIEDQVFLIDRPTETNTLLDHPAVRSAMDADECVPYWADIWPASRMLAKVVWRDLKPGGTALELGCGLGLPGLAALARGWRVIFSDYDATALHFAAHNARVNGLDNFETRQLDWRFPPADLQVPLLLGADLIYELRNIEPLVGTIRGLLSAEGECWLTDQDRVPRVVWRETLLAAGLEFTTQLVRAGEPGGRRYKGTLYRIRHQRPPGIGPAEANCLP